MTLAHRNVAVCPVKSLSQVLILLLASVLVLALARRIGLPAILGYLVVGIAVGPHRASGVLPNGAQTAGDRARSA